jgi:hypothetical protein
MKRFHVGIAIGIAWMLSTVPAGAQLPQRTTVRIKTPLNLIGPGGTFLVMANETRTAAGATTISVVFRNGQGRVVKTVNATYTAVEPAVISLKRAEVPGADPFAVFRADVTLSRPGDFSSTSGAVAFKLVDGTGDIGCPGGCHSCPEEVDGQDSSCAPPEGGRRPEFACPDGTAYLDEIVVEP